jgi:hypothetical protein
LEFIKHYGTEDGLEKMRSLASVKLHCSIDEMIPLISPSAINESTQWQSVWTHPTLLDCLAQHGLEYCGLDGIWKLVKRQGKKYPVYVLNVVHQDSLKGIPVVFAVCSDGTAANIKAVLTSVISAMEKRGINWKPKIMIDKDSAERSAIQSLGLDVLTCDFHNTRTFNAAIHRLVPARLRKTATEHLNAVRYAKTVQDFEAATSAFQHFCTSSNLPALWQYFRDNWLCPEWYFTFAQCFRGGSSFFHKTNNISEAVFRVSVNLFFKRKSCKRMDTLVSILLRQVIPYYVKRCSEFDKGRDTPGTNTQIQAARQRQRRGKELWEQGKVMDTEFDHLVLVRNDKGDDFYTVNIDARICDCPYATHNTGTCKHIFAGFFHRGIFDAAKFGVKNSGRASAIKKPRGSHGRRRDVDCESDSATESNSDIDSEEDISLEAEAEIEAAKEPENENSRAPVAVRRVSSFYRFRS